jgi:hypothetical protein
MCGPGRTARILSTMASSAAMFGDAPIGGQGAAGPAGDG